MKYLLLGIVFIFPSISMSNPTDQQELEKGFK